MSLLRYGRLFLFLLFSATFKILQHHMDACRIFVFVISGDPERFGEVQPS